MATKKIDVKLLYESKVFWVNLIGFCGVIYTIYNPEFILSPENLAMALAGINVVLRTITGKPIVWEKK
jgi:hypothetical protein